MTGMYGTEMGRGCLAAPKSIYRCMKKASQASSLCSLQAKTLNATLTPFQPKGAQGRARPVVLTVGALDMVSDTGWAGAATQDDIVDETPHSCPNLGLSGKSSIFGIVRKKVKENHGSDLRVVCPR